MKQHSVIKNFRSWKSGKKWLYASSVFILTIGGAVEPIAMAYADTTQVQESSVENTSNSTNEKSSPIIPENSELGNSSDSSSKDMNNSSDEQQDIGSKWESSENSIDSVVRKNEKEVSSTSAPSVEFSNSVPTTSITSSNSVQFNWNITTIFNQKIVKTGDQIVLNISASGLDYSTIKFLNGASSMRDFIIKTNPTNNQVILEYTGTGINFTSSTPTTISISARPTKNTENTGVAKTYPYTSQYISTDGETIDLVASNMNLIVKNNDGSWNILGAANYGGSIWKALLPDSSFYNNNYDGVNAVTNNFSYYYTQGAQMWTSGFYNTSGSDFTNAPYTYTVTSNYPIDPESIKLSIGSINHFIEDTRSITWMPDNKGFSVTFSKLTNGAAFAASYYVITGENSNDAVVKINSQITDSSGKNLLSQLPSTGVYYETPNGAFIPNITSENKTIYAGDSLSKKDLLALAKANDQIDGDISDDIIVKSSDGLLSNENSSNCDTSKAGTYNVVYSVENKSGNSNTTTSVITILPNEQSITGSDSNHQDPKNTDVASSDPALKHSLPQTGDASSNSVLGLFVGMLIVALSSILGLSQWQKKNQTKK